MDGRKKSSVWFMIVIAVLVVGLGIPVTQKCGEATYAESRLIFAVVAWTVPDFDLCY